VEYKVLQVTPHENLLCNYLENISDKKLSCDYAVVGTKSLNPRLVAVSGNNGGKVFRISSPHESKLRFALDVRRAVKKGKYSHIHFHSSWASLIALLAIQDNSNIVKVVHSHSFIPPKNKFTHVRNMLARSLLSAISDERFACSTAAGHQMFGKNFVTIPNLIPYDRFRFDSVKRKTIRQELGIEANGKIIGHVGYFFEAKNHEFLLEKLVPILKEDPKTILLLVGGSGEIKYKIQQQAAKQQLSKQVVITGDVLDPSPYYSAMDIFVFPSIFEGFGMALLEAQVSGLPCIYSDVIPSEVIISTKTVQLSLQSSNWTQIIRDTLNSSLSDLEHSERSQEIFDPRLDARAHSDLLLETYRKSYNKKNGHS